MGRLSLAFAMGAVIATNSAGVAGAADAARPAKLTLRLLPPAAAGPGNPVSLGLYKTFVPRHDVVTRFTVTFGDGSRKFTGTRLPRYLTHTFTAAGHYTVRAVITDARHASSAATVVVTVAAPANPTSVAPADPAATDPAATATPSAEASGQADSPEPVNPSAPGPSAPPAPVHGVLSIVAGHNRAVAAGSAGTPLGASGVVTDASGNLYVADSVNSDIEKITPSGALSVVAGVGLPGRPTPGPATSSHLNHPAGLAIDGSGDVFIADSYNSVVEKLTPGGMLSLVAGSGRRGQPVAGAALQSSLSQPGGVAVDAAGDVFIADRYAFEILKVTSGGRLSIYAGTGQSGEPAAGSATKSNLGGPSGVALDAAGDLFIADPVSNAVEKVTPGGQLSIVAGASDGSAGPPTPGPATASALSGPSAVTLDSGGNLFIADTQNTSVEKVDTSGTLSIVAGSPAGEQPTPGPAAASSLGAAVGLASDSAGDLFVADQTYFEIEKISGGTLSIAAGAPPFGDPTPGPATLSSLNGPSGVAYAGDGSLVIADTVNNVVERVAPNGTLSIIAGTGDSGRPLPGPATQSPLSFPSGVAVDAAGDVYIADTDNSEIEEVSTAGTLRVIAGTGSFGKPTNGPATASALSLPGAVAVDAAGDVYIADTFNDDVEKVTPDGTLSIVAGTSGAGSPTAGPGLASSLRYPGGLAFDRAGDLLIADTGNNVVEQVTPGGALTVIAGTGGSGPAVAGQPTAVPLNGPVGLAVDTAGSLYVSLATGTQIVKISDGSLSLVAGAANAPCFPTVGLATSSAVYGPQGLALDPAGDLFVADSAADDVERISS